MAEISEGSVMTERDVAASGLTAEGSPAVSVMRRGSPGLQSSATRWLTSSAVQEVEARPGDPQEVEEAGGGQPWGSLLTGWLRKVSCPGSHSWMEPGWARHSPDLPVRSWTSGSFSEAPRVRLHLAGRPWGSPSCNLYPLISSATETIQTSRSTLYILAGQRLTFLT